MKMVRNKGAPKDGFVIAVLGCPSPAADKPVEEWTLYCIPRTCEGPWISLKLAATGYVANKSSYWIGWNPARGRFDHWGDSTLLRTLRPELHKLVEEAIHVFVMSLELTSGGDAAGLTAADWPLWWRKTYPPSQVPREVTRDSEPESQLPTTPLDAPIAPLLTGGEGNVGIEAHSTAGDNEDLI